MIHGKNIIGYERSGKSFNKVKSFNPKENKTNPYEFHCADENETTLALQKASSAFIKTQELSLAKKGAFLNLIADEILADETIIQLGMEETALPEARLRAERNRTAFQLRSYAEAILNGFALEISIDTAIPDRQPLPKMDIRKMNIGIGPVLVFAAGNFPLAYSVCGGDTASAFAAGNPVIVKAHSGHPATSEAVGEAVIRAAKALDLPDGIFSLLHGEGRILGQQLVQADEIKACGFTGSFQAGKNLFDLAAQRKEPIPVFAEMGSINPVFILPSALQSNASALATQLASSITLHAGQYCTNPGILLGLNTPETHEFINLLAVEIQQILPQSMLNPKTYHQFTKQKDLLLSQEHIEKLAESELNANPNRFEAESIIAKVSAASFLTNPQLHQEVFGPFSLFVLCKNPDEMHELAKSFAGQLTSSVYCADVQDPNLSILLTVIKEKAGRLIMNSVPTGVEVCPAQQHGGPYPASTDSRFSSVGWSAIRRFMRPIAFQNFPQELLPEPCKNENQLGLWRCVNGSYSKESIG